MTIVTIKHKVLLLESIYKPYYSAQKMYKPY